MKIGIKLFRLWQLCAQILESVVVAGSCPTFRSECKGSGVSGTSQCLPACLWRWPSSTCGQNITTAGQAFARTKATHGILYWMHCSWLKGIHRRAVGGGAQTALAVGASCEARDTVLSTARTASGTTYQCKSSERWPSVVFGGTRPVGRLCAGRGVGGTSAVSRAPRARLSRKPGLQVNPLDV